MGSFWKELLVRKNHSLWSCQRTKETDSSLQSQRAARRWAESYRSVDKSGKRFCDPLLIASFDNLSSWTFARTSRFGPLDLKFNFWTSKFEPLKPLNSNLRIRTSKFKPLKPIVLLPSSQNIARFESQNVVAIARREQRRPGRPAEDPPGALEETRRGGDAEGRSKALLSVESVQGQPVLHRLLGQHLRWILWLWLNWLDNQWVQWVRLKN